MASADPRPWSVEFTQGGRPKSEIIARMCIGDEQLRVCSATGMGDTLRWLLRGIELAAPAASIYVSPPPNTDAPGGGRRAAGRRGRLVSGASLRPNTLRGCISPRGASG